MQRTTSNTVGLGGSGGGHGGSTPTGQNAAPFFSLYNASSTDIATTTTTGSASGPRPRPGTSAGEHHSQRGGTLNTNDTLPPLPPLPATDGLAQQPFILQQPPPYPPPRPTVLTKDRRPSLGKKASPLRRRASSNGSGSAGGPSLFHHQSAGSISAGTGSNPFDSLGRRDTNAGHSYGGNAYGGTHGHYAPVTSPTSAASSATTSSNLFQQQIAQIQQQQLLQQQQIATMMGTALSANGLPLTGSLSNMAGTTLAPSAILSSTSTGMGATMIQSESTMMLQHIQDLVNKRISTLDYLRKAHDGRVYWFNTLRFDRPDLARMPYFDPRRLARRATNYLLLGLSLPAVIDLNSSTALELLRSLNALLSEFDTYQQLHSETGSGSAANSLSRAARLPHMFRRATPGGKARRTSSSAASGMGGDFGGGVGGGGGGDGSSIGSGGGGGPAGTGGGVGAGGFDGLGSIGGSTLTLVTSEGTGAGGGGGSSTSGLNPTNGVGSNGAVAIAAATAAATASATATTAFATLYDNNVDLLPGEEYAFLLTPSLPFDPDFFETFATLCDVLIDCYTRILGLVPTARECSAPVVEQFTKADAKVRKLLVQGAVKEFEDYSRGGVKSEVASIGKVVLGGLM